MEWKVLLLCFAVIGGLNCKLIESDLKSSTDDEEMNWLEAKIGEVSGPGLDDDDDKVDDDKVDDVTSSTIDDSAVNETIHGRVLENGDIQVEDMILSPELFNVMYPQVKEHEDEMASVHRRAATSSKSKLWPSATVYYAYNKNLAGSQSKVKAAMDTWSKYTCVKFVYRSSSQSAHSQIRSTTNTCSSAVGYTGKLQYINLAKNCFSSRTILHEIGHTLGLIHEHQHPDRNKYVTIVWDNINPAKKRNFEDRGSRVSSWGIKYDPYSIMHYGAKAFRKSGCKSPCYTIKSKTSSKMTSKMGSAKSLSKKSDIPIIKKMYNCK